MDGKQIIQVIPVPSTQRITARYESDPGQPEQHHPVLFFGLQANGDVVALDLDMREGTLMPCEMMVNFRGLKFEVN